MLLMMAVIDNPAVPEGDNPIRCLCDLKAVVNENLGSVAFEVQSQKQFQNHPAVCQVKIDSRLVGKDNLHFVDLCPADGAALLFTAGELGM